MKLGPDDLKHFHIDDNKKYFKKSASNEDMLHLAVGVAKVVVSGKPLLSRPTMDSRFESATPFSFCLGHIYRKILKSMQNIQMGTKANTRIRRGCGLRACNSRPEYHMQV